MDHDISARETPSFLMQFIFSLDRKYEETGDNRCPFLESMM